MARLVANRAFDMLEFLSEAQLADFFESASVITHTASAFAIRDIYSGITETLNLGGSFGGYSPDFYPSTGTISSAAYAITGGASFTLTGLAITVPDFTNFVLADNTEGLFAKMLAGNDQIVGSSAADVLLGMNGNDTLTGNGGNDELWGGLGNDIYYIESTGDQVFENASAGIDTVMCLATLYVLPDDSQGHVENLTYTGASAFTGIGNFLNNVIRGGPAGDTLDGKTGIDTMYGNNGHDTYYVDHSSDKAIESSATGGTDRVISSVSYTLGANVERLTLTGTAVKGIGNALVNVITGNASANILNGAAGADSMSGGDGNDIYYVDHSSDRIIETATGGTDTVRATASVILAAYVENLLLEGSAVVRGTGNGLANSITGNSAANVLSGLAGNDALNGGAGNDSLNGGVGSDRMTGGVGLDKFVFDTALGTTNVDRIMDFNVADDTIVLDQTVFTQLATLGKLTAPSFWTGSAAHDADDRIIYDSASGKLYYDIDGSGAAAKVLFAQVTAGLTLTNADFLVVA